MSSRHSVAAALLLLAACHGRQQERSVPGSVTANGFTLTTASATLIDDDLTLPDGPGVEAVRNNCTGCHSAAMILSQPKLTPAQWQAEVEKMVKAYHAPVDSAAVPAIEAYLNGLRGD